MKRDKKILISIVAIFLISVLGYQVYKSYDYEIEIKKAYDIKKNNSKTLSFDGYAEPPIPNAEISELTLLGTDYNKNGLRDDVEIWINRTQKDPNVRNALRQLHLVYQNIMTIKTDEGPSVDSVKANKYFQAEAEAEECLEGYLGYEASQKLYKTFYEIIQNRNSKNTEKFRSAIDQTSSGIGTVGGLSQKEKILKYCKFNIGKMNE